LPNGLWIWVTFVIDNERASGIASFIFSMNTSDVMDSKRELKIEAKLFLNQERVCKAMRVDDEYRVVGYEIDIIIIRFCG
jgi:hypothetical protein